MPVRSSAGHPKVCWFTFVSVSYILSFVIDSFAFVCTRSCNIMLVCLYTSVLQFIFACLRTPKLTIPN
ncbi:hypothetical protein BD769DRAFT_508039 [Suillus cothurnatus]|nr:hypothetical protein BD769DRAFT_508039 [Suillus cothurnatus]